MRSPLMDFKDYFIHEEIKEIYCGASLEKGLLNSLVDGTINSIEYKRSILRAARKEEVDLELSDVLQSVLTVIQLYKMYDCSTSIAVMHILLNKVDEKNNSCYASQVPGFWWREGKYTPPALILELTKDSSRRWVCTPAERERCGAQPECIYANSKLNQKVEFQDEPTIETKNFTIYPIPWGPSHYARRTAKA